MSYIKTVSFDCADALRVATFWAAVLNSDVDEDSTAEKAYVEAPGWGGPNMWFTRVPEPKAAKNRMHFDLRARPARRRGRPLDRAWRVGARRPRRPRRVQDPEGNEFCVEPGFSG